MKKEEVIEMLDSMGFRLDYDQWDVTSKEWMRFHLRKEGMNTPDLALIWFKDSNSNFRRVAIVLFMAGQKANMLRATEFVSL